MVKASQEIQGSTQSKSPSKPLEEHYISDDATEAEVPTVHQQEIRVYTLPLSQTVNFSDRIEKVMGIQDKAISRMQLPEGLRRVFTLNSVFGRKRTVQLPTRILPRKFNVSRPMYESPVPKSQAKRRPVWSPAPEQPSLLLNPQMTQYMTPVKRSSSPIYEDFEF